MHTTMRASKRYTLRLVAKFQSKFCHSQRKKKKRKNKNLINLITKVSFTVNIVNQDSIWTKRQVLCKPQEFN